MQRGMTKTSPAMGCCYPFACSDSSLGELSDVLDFPHFLCINDSCILSQPYFWTRPGFSLQATMCFWETSGFETGTQSTEKTFQVIRPRKERKKRKEITAHSFSPKWVNSYRVCCPKAEKVIKEKKKSPPGLHTHTHTHTHIVPFLFWVQASAIYFFLFNSPESEPSKTVRRGHSFGWGKEDKKNPCSFSVHDLMPVRRVKQVIYLQPKIFSMGVRGKGRLGYNRLGGGAALSIPKRGLS